MHFNSHAPRGARRKSVRLLWAYVLFQLTRPARGATSLLAISSCFAEFQLTRPARGATDASTELIGKYNISTHTPREGRDCKSCAGSEKRSKISTHTPREGRDRFEGFPARISPISTHTPREGRDQSRRKGCSRSYHFNSHAPRGARRLHEEFPP